MRSPFSSAPRPSPLRKLEFAVPAFAVSALMFLVGSGLAFQPLGMLVTAPALILMLSFVVSTAPLLVYWLVPASMPLYLAFPVELFDLLVLFLAVVTFFAARTKRSPGLRLQPVEWRFLLFIVFLFTAFLHPVDPRRFLYSIKLFAMGLVAFEVARQAVPTFGRTALAWGPALFCGITSLQLFIRLTSSGIPSFKSVILRTYITDLAWGTSNYVSAVLVVCLPTLLYLTRNQRARSGRYWLALAILAGTLGSLLLTSSRGGFVLTAGLFLVRAVRVRRLNWVAVAGGAAAILVLATTPFGIGLLGRFTSQKGTASVLFRFAIWKSAFDRGMAHLPFGVGAGQGFVTRDRLADTDAHNFPLTLFSETGPIGLLLWIWVVVALIRASGRLSRSPGTRPAGQALVMTVAIMIMNSLFEPTMTGYLYQTLFWWIAGMFHGAGSPGDLASPELREHSLQAGEIARDARSAGASP